MAIDMENPLTSSAFDFEPPASTTSRRSRSSRIPKMSTDTSRKVQAVLFSILFTFGLVFVPSLFENDSLPGNEGLNLHNSNSGGRTLFSFNADSTDLVDVASLHNDDIGVCQTHELLLARSVLQPQTCPDVLVPVQAVLN